MTTAGVAAEAEPGRCSTCGTPLRPPPCAECGEPGYHRVREVEISATDELEVAIQRPVKVTLSLGLGDMLALIFTWLVALTLFSLAGRVLTWLRAAGG